MHQAIPGGCCPQTYEQGRHLVPASALAQPGKPWLSSMQRCAQSMGTGAGVPGRAGGVCSTLQLWEEGRMSPGQSSPSWGHRHPTASTPPQGAVALLRKVRAQEDKERCIPSRFTFSFGIRYLRSPTSTHSSRQIPVRAIILETLQ